ncbi:MAG: hypothetical protein A3J83_02215 [Elusimicrobia bacterium RIFOXYA2_FULL_40_6]|nr:MAG: hypothetical protein A3J83_02215 [Elusimicrobia bacterium RIFOXYA2_FULL_40_6]
MKAYIITDMEGITGVCIPEQVLKGNPEYSIAQKLFANDVNAAVEGLIEAGFDKIVVNDGHCGAWQMNFILEEMHPEAEYIFESTNTLSGLDSSFDAALLIGYHAMAGTNKAVLDHTQSSKNWVNYYLNGKKMGEIGQMAILAGHYKIPVIFVSGDLAATKEARALLGKDLETVSVKEGYNRTCAKCLHPKKTYELIKEGVKKAVTKIDKMKPYTVKSPIETKLEVVNAGIADLMQEQGAERIGPRTVRRIVKSPLDILKF